MGWFVTQFKPLNLQAKNFISKHKLCFRDVYTTGACCANENKENKLQYSDETKRNLLFSFE